jgi:hypothetical protein
LGGVKEGRSIHNRQQQGSADVQDQSLPARGVEKERVHKIDDAL